MSSRRHALSSVIAAVGACAGTGTVLAQATGAASSPPIQAELPLFAVEFKTGPRWDFAKQAHEQTHFAEHSANLRRLREQGRILVGARYADKGLMIVAGASADEVHALFAVDPSVQNQVFACEVHPFQVFYPGCVTAPKRRSSSLKPDKPA